MQKREAELGRGPVETQLKLIAPPQFLDLTSPAFHNFKTRLRTESGIDLQIESAESNLQLLLKALRSAPGTYDAALLFHYQLRPLRHERRLDPLFAGAQASQSQQRTGLARPPIVVAPDFRILPDGRDLRTGLPLFWGFLDGASNPSQVPAWASSMAKAISSPSANSKKTLWVLSLVALEGGQWDSVRKLTKAMIDDGPSLIFSLVQASPGRSTFRWNDNQRKEIEDLEKWTKDFDPADFRKVSLLELEMPSDEILQALDENRDPSKTVRSSSPGGLEQQDQDAHDEHDHDGHDH
ncbi:MAG TPA: hypothetical protein PLZ57_06215 [Pseudobdellovibrionaceae bacterium]|nr:hypothetical protein [Pseudobdellovibrionaceae bacterium]